MMNIVLWQDWTWELTIISVNHLVFLRNKGIVLSRRRLLELLWDTTGEFINDNTLTVYMKRLRDKIETNPQEPEIIITVRGLGYKVG